ncbi:MAG: DUF4240 domain-containing protein [Polyangiaceae bacterium]
MIEAADGDLKRLEAALEPLNRGELIRFCWAWDQAVADLRSDEMWDHVEDGVSEDGLYHICQSVVGHGRAAYEAGLRDFTTMPRSVEVQEPTVSFGDPMDGAPVACALDVDD